MAHLYIGLYSQTEFLKRFGHCAKYSALAFRGEARSKNYMRSKHLRLKIYLSKLLSALKKFLSAGSHEEINVEFIDNGYMPSNSKRIRLSK